MRTTQKIAVLSLFLAGALSTPLKTKLQANSHNLAQVSEGMQGQAPAGGNQGLQGGAILREGEAAAGAYPLECPCEFSELPGLGAGLSKGFAAHAEVSNVQNLQAVPDTQYNQICQSNCCECAESQQASTGNGSKNRTFTINGAITVVETVTTAEDTAANEWSRARQEKDTVCVTTNQSGASLTGQ